MEIIKVIGEFFIQPLLWLGILYTLLLYQLRIKNERNNFRIAINKDWYEIRHFVKKGLVWGLILSIFSVIIGIFIPIKYVFIYEIFAMVSMLFLPVIDLSALPLYILGVISYQHGEISSSIFMLLLSLNYFMKAHLTGKNDKIWFSPRERQGKRGRRIVQYCFHELTVLPLLILIPGNLVSNFKFIPLIHFGELKFSFFILPFFVGSVGKIFKETAKNALEYYRKQNMLMCLIAFAGFIIGTIFPKSSLVLTIFILLASVWMIFKRKKKDEKSNQWYVETNMGIRIVAIRPDTPAAKMNLEPGDIILNCNGRHVTNENQFYAALQLNSAYCHLKLKTFNGDLKIAEGAIYNDSPYELGIVLFQNK
nr:PDZ domain-containing protein [uncultured Ligilactobacillus sp.]